LLQDVAVCSIISLLCCPALWATEFGNNQATNITKKGGLGNNKEKEILHKV
jgi:hypothetical protein